MDVIADYAEGFGVYEDMGRFLAIHWGRGNHIVQNGGGLCDVCKWRRTGRTDIGGPYSGPLWQNRLSSRSARLFGMWGRSTGRRAQPINHLKPRTRDG